MDTASSKIGLNSTSGVLSYRAHVYCACTILALVTNYFLGKDMAWDMLNYHLYAGFSAINDRFGQDYFAAGPQSYFNPYAYVPFYLLARSGLSSLAISSILAAVHSIILWLTFELALCICPSSEPRTRAVVGACAVAMAFVNPILIQQLGSSFADITTAELVLGGWVLLALAVRMPQPSKVVAGALLIGAATALKLTNAVHAIAAIVMFAFLPLPRSAKLRFGLRYLVFAGLGFAVVALPWSYRLEHMFSNPFFPLLNNVFHSPEFTTEPLRQFRFIPGSVLQALWRPFAMIDPVRMVHEELSAPDPRYAVIIMVSSALLIRRFWRGKARSTSTYSVVDSMAATRVLSALGCAFIVDWVLWLSESGNSRYFLPMACVAGVIVVALLFNFFDRRPKLRNYILLVIFATQVTQLILGAEFRWAAAAAWDRRWINITVPQKLATEANLYLTMGLQSDSFIALYLARGSGFVNFSGSYTPLAADGASGARVEGLIHRYSPHVRIVLRGAKLYEDEEMRTPRRSHVDDALARFGLRVNTDDCDTFNVRGLRPELEIAWGATTSNDPILGNTTFFVSCRVVPDEDARSALSARQSPVDSVLDRLEDACPELLQPRRAGTELDGSNWHRLYMNSDLKASVNNGWVRIRDPLRADSLIYAGRESDWIDTGPRLACGRGPNGYFAKPLKSK
jgi:hypothetical protein